MVEAEEEMEQPAEQEPQVEEEDEPGENALEVEWARRAQRFRFGECKATCCETKAYIQRWKAIANCSASRSNHKEAVAEVMEKLKMFGCAMDYV